MSPRSAMVEESTSMEAGGSAGRRRRRRGSDGLLALLASVVVPTAIIAGVIFHVPVWLIAVALLVIPALVAGVAWLTGTLPAWFGASGRGVEASPRELLALRRLGVEPGPVLEAAARLRAEGVQVRLGELGAYAAAGGDVEALVPRLAELERRRMGWSMDEFTQMAGAEFDVARAIDAMLASNRAGRSLSFAEACEMQMEGAEGSRLT